MSSKSKKKVTAEEFDRMFDAGEDLSGAVDFSKAKRVEPKKQLVNVEFPEWVVDALDQESTRQGITRQALIKTWIVAKVDERRHI